MNKKKNICQNIFVDEDRNGRHRENKADGIISFYYMFLSRMRSICVESSLDSNLLLCANNVF